MIAKAGGMNVKNVDTSSKRYFVVAIAIIGIIFCTFPITEGDPDVTPPQVVHVFPYNNTTASTDTYILIRFNEPMFLDSFPSNFTLRDSITTIEGYFSSDVAATRMYFYPKDDLAYNTTYYAELVGAVDLSGNLLEENITWQFNTEAHADEVNLDDIDADGLLDTWEIIIFGNITSQSGSDDFDNDNYNNTQEYQYGTNPTDPEDYPILDDNGTEGFGIWTILIAMAVAFITVTVLRRTL